MSDIYIGEKHPPPFISDGDIIAYEVSRKIIRDNLADMVKLLRVVEEVDRRLLEAESLITGQGFDQVTEIRAYMNKELKEIMDKWE